MNEIDQELKKFLGNMSERHEDYSSRKACFETGFKACYELQEAKIKELREALDWATKTASDTLLKIGHRGSNLEDRLNDDRYEKCFDMREKFKLDEL